MGMTFKKAGALAFGFALLAAGCGDSKSDDAAAPATTAGEGTGTTAGGGGGAFKVDDSKCPADAKAPLAAGAPIKLGVSLPQTGPAAAFGAVGPGMKIVFDKVNAEKGGIGGHKIELITRDDGYEPARSVANTTQLLQQDKVLATALDIGTPNVAGTRKMHADACVPQLYVGTGSPAWGDPKNNPWTIGGIPAYNTEAKIWAEYIGKTKPGAKVAMLIFNNDFGKVYQRTIEAEAKKNGFTIVETKLHEATAPTIDNEVTSMIAAQPDFVLGGTTGTFCPKLMAGLAKGGYKGKTFISLTCASVASFFKPVDPAGEGVMLLGAQKDPSDAQYADDPAMVQYKKDVAQYGGGANPNDGSITTGYNIGHIVVAALEKAQASGAISRVSLMNAAWTVDTPLPLALGGRFKIDGVTDAYGSETLEFVRYDATKKAQVLTGDKFDYEGKTGLFQAG